MSIIKGFFSLAVIFLLVMAVLFIDFTYKTFSVSQRNVKTDAIVVLAGGRGRIEEGVRLYREHQARYLFLIGVDPSVRKSDLFRERRGEEGEGVLLEKVSRNTLENAFYARDLILKKEITIYPHPVDSKNLKEEWWSHGGSFRLLFSEFYKYCLFRFFFLFAP